MDIPLSRINSVRFEHGLIDRIWGAGTLIIESASDEPLEFDDIPQVEYVHSLLYREVNDNPDDDFHAHRRQPGRALTWAPGRSACRRGRVAGARRAAGRGEHLGGRRPRRVAERVDRAAGRGQAGVPGPAGRRGPAHPGGHQLRVSQVDPAAGRRRGSARRPAARDGVRYPVLVPNERGLDRALAAGVTDIAIFASATETFAKRNLNRTLDEQFAMFDPVVARARTEGLDVRGYVSMCFGDPWEGSVDAGAGRVGRSAAAGHGLLAAVPRRHHRRGNGRPGRGAARRASSRPAPRSARSPCTSTTPTARRWPTRSPRCASECPLWTLRPADSAAARTPSRRPATWPPRTWCGCWTAWASAPASTWTSSSRPARGWPSGSAGRARPGWSARIAG